MSPRRSNLLDLLFSAPAYQAAKQPYQDPGTADIEPFPFLALVGQKEMKLALLLSLVNPAIGGVLLIGARGLIRIVEHEPLAPGVEPNHRLLGLLDLKLDPGVFVRGGVERVLVGDTVQCPAGFGLFTGLKKLIGLLEQLGRLLCLNLPFPAGF